MKILLMTPITSFVELPPNSPDLGLGYLATSLGKSGHDVYIRDWNMNPSARNFRKWLTANKPEVIGIKVFTKDVRAANKTISIVRKALPQGIIVIGGPHPSAADPVELMEDFSECDFALKGEAEIIFCSLLAGILERKQSDSRSSISKERAEEIPGLVWRNKGNVHSNPTSLNQNLDTIDFPSWSLIDPNGYSADMLGSEMKEGAAAPIITTRGCPGKCSFCSAFNINGRKIRSRSPSNVFEEILMLFDRYNVRKFMFQDNCFTSIKENLTGLCDLIVAKRMNIEWDCVSYQRLDNLTDETLRLMYRAGCRMLHMGIESGSKKTRKTMNKTCSLGEITDKVRLLKRNGIKVGAWFMIGFPGETKKEMKETIKYAFSLDVDLITFTIVFPLPGTQIYYYLREKYNFERLEWANFDIFSSMYPASTLSSKKLASFLKLIRFRIRMDTKLKRISRLLGRK